MRKPRERERPTQRDQPKRERERESYLSPEEKDEDHGGFQQHSVVNDAPIRLVIRPNLTNERERDREREREIGRESER